MISPSDVFTGSVNLCGEPGAEFGREMEAWKRPALVSHPRMRMAKLQRTVAPSTWARFARR